MGFIWFGLGVVVGAGGIIVVALILRAGDLSRQEETYLLTQSKK